MYEDFYQLQADPFRLSPDHRFCFTHSSYGKAKAYMHYALHRAEGFVMITGKPGTGKTTLVNDLLDDLSLAKITVAMLVSTQLEADDLLRMVAFSFGLNGDFSDKATIIQKLTVFLTRHCQEGRHALLIVDEAQDLSISAMEELRLLTNLQINNQPLLQIFLLGQEELRDLMQGPKMEQGHQRIVAACHLEPLKEEETAAYIRHRLCKVGWDGNPQISTTIFPIIHKFSLGIPRKINLICSRLFLHAFVEKLQKIGVNDIRIVLTELQQEQLIPSNQAGYPMLEAVDFFELEDDYTDEVEQSPKSEATAKEIRSPTVPIPELEVPLSPDIPVNELPTGPDPIEPVTYTTAPTRLLTPENVTQAELTAALAPADQPMPEKNAIQVDKGIDPGQHVDSHFISPDKVPVTPEKPGPIPSEMPDPIPVPKLDPGPAASENDDSPPERAPPDYSEIPQISIAAPTDLARTTRNRRYWLLTLSLVGLLAIGAAFYVINRTSFDFRPLVQQARQLKAYIFDKVSPQKPAITSNKLSLTQPEVSHDTNQKWTAPTPVPAAHTELLKPIETPTVSDPVASDQDQQDEMISEKAAHPVEQTRYADNIETTDDLSTTTLMVDTVGLATAEHPIDNHAPESSGIDSAETPAAIATTGNETTLNRVQARLVLFPYKSMEILPQFKELLDEVADELKDSQYAGARIVGIIDNRGKGSSDYKRSISIQRAKEVAGYLINRGIAPERLRIEENTNLQKDKPESSEYQTSHQPERAVEVTVLAPVGRESQRAAMVLQTSLSKPRIGNAELLKKVPELEAKSASGN